MTTMIFKRQPRFSSSCRWFIAALTGLVACAPAVLAQTQITNTPYRGWNSALVLGNGIVEAIVVPEIGRIQAFRWAGTTNNIFWESATMRGLPAAANNYTTDGASFGADKAWPSPQSAWAGSATSWPPIVGFDCAPYTSSVSNGTVTITGPVDGTNTGNYGIYVTRTIALDSNRPVMRVMTSFTRIAATSRLTNQLGIWIDTQVNEPVRAFALLPTNSAFSSGYTLLQSTAAPTSFQAGFGLVSFTRDTSASHKIGFDGGSLFWVGTNTSMRMDAPRVAGLSLSNYPDGGCSTEIYTPSGSSPYMEFEVLGPLTNLGVGQTFSFEHTYTLYHRAETNAVDEARKVLGLDRLAINASSLTVSDTAAGRQLTFTMPGAGAAKVRLFYKDVLSTFSPWNYLTPWITVTNSILTIQDAATNDMRVYKAVFSPTP